MRSNHYQLIILAIVCLSLFASCKNEYYKITEEEELEWMPYGKKDQILFVSSQGDVDTFKVQSLTKAYKDGYNEFLEASITKLNDTVAGDETTGGVHLYKSADGLSVKVRLPHYYLFEEITNKPLQIMTVSGINYYDVIMLISNPIFIDNDTYMDTLYYSKSNGFIMYIDKNGETWSLLI